MSLELLGWNFITDLQQIFQASFLTQPTDVGVSGQTPCWQALLEVKLGYGPFPVYSSSALMHIEMHMHPNDFVIENKLIQLNF